ncbi:VWA domain-containing protein [Arthrobacter sp. GMC3]|uniref:VWA domain-containing protein n=1 Tax=Arthrobacter sp. GMC3 TaxID=2058894 RepID=UPI000CE54C1B|nr:VWA domain-containing protein [Arthrobacter sp. GMC3]
MALTYWWVLLAGAAAMAAVLVWIWRHPCRSADSTPIAHADRLTALPSYQKALAHQKRWLAVALVSVLVLAASLLMAAARPVSESTNIPEQKNRDIMLCLDVSGSMIDTDEAIVGVFAEMVTAFKGERIGLTIFDSSAVQVFPLTDDYEFVAEQLKNAKSAMSGSADSFDFFDGTYEANGSSLIGDGLLSCVNGFPGEGETQRSRSVIFATDNMLSGKPIFTLPEAAAVAAKAKVRVYALNPNDFGSQQNPMEEALELKTAATSTGGLYYALDSGEAVNSIVHKVQATEAAKLQGAPVKSLSDHPGLPLGLALLALFGLGAAVWKVRQ